MSGDAHVQIQQVDKQFGATKAVDSLSLDIAKGSFTTLLGPSGCGKTTTLRMLAGFFDPDAGDIRIGGRSQRGVPPHRRNVSIVFQDYALFPHMTVLQNVSYGLKLRRLPTVERRKRVDRVLDFLGLAALAERHPHELSGGQQQRVALGRSIAMEPEVLLMDEPLSNLDAKLRVRVRAELKEIQRALGITTIYVTHDQDEALGLSDHVAVMSDGRLQQFSDPWTLYHEPANRFVADFVGQANVLRGRCLASDGLRCEVELGGQRLLCRDPFSLGQPGQAVSVLVRPEWWTSATLSDEGAGDGAEGDSRAAGAGLFDGSVQTGTFLGAYARLWVRVDGLDDTVLVDIAVRSKHEVEQGRRLRIALPAGAAMVIADD